MEREESCTLQGNYGEQRSRNQFLKKLVETIIQGKEHPTRYNIEAGQEIQM